MGTAPTLGGDGQIGTFTIEGPAVGNEATLYQVGTGVNTFATLLGEGNSHPYMVAGTLNLKNLKFLAGSLTQTPVLSVQSSWLSGGGTVSAQDVSVTWRFKNYTWATGNVGLTATQQSSTNGPVTTLNLSSDSNCELYCYIAGCNELHDHEVFDGCDFGDHIVGQDHRVRA